MCEEFGLMDLITFNKPYDPDIINQFYAIVHFQMDDYCTSSWLTSGVHLVSNFNKFSNCIGFPRSGIPGTGDEYGWRCHDASDPLDRKALKGMYIHGWEELGKLNHLLPVWDIMIRIFRETVNPKGGNFDEIHLYEVDLLANAKKMQGQGIKMDIADYIFHEM